MDSATGGSSGSGGESDHKRRPRPPILDLKASEVKTDVPSTEASAKPSEPADPDRAAAERLLDPVPPTADPIPDSLAKVAAEPEARQTTGNPLGPEPAAEMHAQQRSDPIPSMADPTPDPSGDMPPEWSAAAQNSPASDADATAAGNQRATPRAEDADPAAPRSPRQLRWEVAGLALGAGAGAAAGAAGLLTLAWLFGLSFGSDRGARETNARMAALEARIEAVSRRPFPPPDPRIDEIAQRASAGEQALAQIKALEARLAQAEAALARAPTGGGPELAQRVAATEQSTQSLSAALADLGRRLDEAVTTAQAARGTATQAAAEEVRTLSARLAALEETSRALQAAATTANRPDRDRAARLATAGLALKSAVEAGTPFAAELAAVKAAGADPAKLSPLEPFAASGLPSTQALTRELASLIASHRRQTEPAAANAGFFEWLQAGVARLVRIRPVDAPAPADSGDALAKVQASAARGAFAEAVSEAAKLPEQLRAPLDPWIQKAQGRVAALAAAHEVARDSLTALAAPDRQPIQQ